MEIIARQRNPYFITGPAQIGVSGGRSSAYMMYKILQAHNGLLPIDVYPTFENTGKEREETLNFLKKMCEIWNFDITWIEYCREFNEPESPSYKLIDYSSASRNSESFDKFLGWTDKYRMEKNEPLILPNNANKMCSDRLKTKGAQWFMKSQGYKNWDAIIGIRYDEPRRYHNNTEANENGSNPWDIIMPMYESGVIKLHIADFWSNQSFDLGIHSDDGNCDLCFKKHPNKLLRAIRAEPWRAEWWISQEKRNKQIFRSDGLSYEALLNFAKNQQVFEFNLPESEESINCMSCTD
jgi:3'-phosphoadenosine 5'-phosphosulfate sulfotransferase (PAPS reductase)/FAD synthetase